MCNPLVNHYLKYISDKSKPLVKASESILFFPDCCKERISNLPSAQSTKIRFFSTLTLPGLVSLHFIGSEVEKIFTENKIAVVVNLAAQAGVRYSITNPDAYIQSNLIGFYNILEACRHHEVEHLVYASSSSVYGSNKKVPYSTDDKVDNPVSLYAATKKSNELMAPAYSKLYNIPSTGLRFFTVYGPAGRPDMAYFGFTNKLVKGESIKIFNYGNCMRDFTYVDDIVEGVVRIMPHGPQKHNGED